MIYAAYLEWSSSKKNAFKDYKPVIISIGILGTFIGIFCGLWNFNTGNITASVPLLLEGFEISLYNIYFRYGCVYSNVVY